MRKLEFHRSSCRNNRERSEHAVRGSSAVENDKTKVGGGRITTCALGEVSLVRAGEMFVWAAKTQTDKVMAWKAPR